MAITSTQHHGQDVSQHPEGSSTAAAQAPARVVLLDNRDSFVYNLVDQFATPAPPPAPTTPPPSRSASA